MLPAYIVFLLSLSSASSSASSPAADDCVLDLAVVCLDDRALAYVDWLEGRDKLNVVGDFVTIVRKHAGRAEDRSKPQRHQQRPAPHGQRQRVGTALGPAIDEYFDTHTLRISLPWILDGDIDLELDRQGGSDRPRGVKAR